MGTILSLFRKPNVEDELDALDAKILQLRNYNRTIEERYRKAVRICYYLLSAIVIGVLLCLYTLPFNYVREKYIYLCIFLLACIFLYSLQRILSWHYDRQTAGNKLKIAAAIRERDEKLKYIMENETYNAAKSILEKYAPRVPPQPARPIPGSQLVAQNFPRAQNGANQSDLRQRIVPQSGTGAAASATLISSGGLQRMTPAPVVNTGEKSLAQRMAEMIIGDSAENRFALICSHCYTHNGLVLAEEYAYTKFVCYKCGLFNGSQKERPVPPKLPIHHKGPELPGTPTEDAVEPSGEDTAAEITADDVLNSETEEVESGSAAADESTEKSGTANKSVDESLLPSTSTEDN